MTEWASYYDEIPEALSNNDVVQSHALELIDNEPILGKSTEGGSRTEDLRVILREFFQGDIDHQDAEQRIWEDLPPSESPHRGNNRVFHDQWAERLIRSQGSRFYNQSVMEVLEDRGETECYVPRSPRQYADSDCTIHLAESRHSINELLEALYSQQRQGNWDDGVTIPGHANCTHTVVPLEVVEEV